MNELERIKQLAGIDEDSRMDDPNFRPSGTAARLNPKTRSKLQQVYKVATAKGEQNLKGFQKGGGASIDNIVDFLATEYLEKNVNLPKTHLGMTPPMPIDSFVDD
tara:strand:- start:18 stop:332 length:315 start_codon:yes stop_codon:yes gene_type:complete